MSENSAHRSTTHHASSSPCRRRSGGSRGLPGRSRRAADGFVVSSTRQARSPRPLRRREARTRVGPGQRRRAPSEESGDRCRPRIRRSPGLSIAASDRPSSSRSPCREPMQDQEKRGADNPAQHYADRLAQVAPQNEQDDETPQRRDAPTAATDAASVTDGSRNRTPPAAWSRPRRVEDRSHNRRSRRARSTGPCPVVGYTRPSDTDESPNEIVVTSSGGSSSSARPYPAARRGRGRRRPITDILLTGKNIAVWPTRLPPVGTATVGASAFGRVAPRATAGTPRREGSGSFPSHAAPAGRRQVSRQLRLRYEDPCEARRNEGADREVEGCLGSARSPKHNDEHGGGERDWKH